MGLKAIAIYRDGSKRSQPLNTGKKKDTERRGRDRRGCRGVAGAWPRAEAVPAPPPGRTQRPSRTSSTSPATRATSRSACTRTASPARSSSRWPRKAPRSRGLMDTFATTVSVALQYGVPLHDLVDKFAHVRFEPAGFTGNPEIPIAKSIVDYIFRWLGSRFLPPEDRAKLGLVDRPAEPKSTVQPLNLGLGGAPGEAGSAGTPGSGEPRAPKPASPGSGTNASEAGTAALSPARAAAPATARGRHAPLQRALRAVPAATATPEVATEKPTATAPPASGPPSAASASARPRSPSEPRPTPPPAPTAARSWSATASCYECLNCGSTSGCS